MGSIRVGDHIASQGNSFFFPQPPAFVEIIISSISSFNKYYLTILEARNH